ncbi:unnamed protein product [Brachionus calyciflorus]|uniref:Tr-type G domain-containing protein n=1 Tax=Brachionus calyciflorus TaxID=104777 RepID=A0A814C000_9BILA|nr:unnamed protein product [Brachionus calyciflorus]
MSRHRNVRKVSVVDDDYDDEFSQSFDEKYSYAVSPGTSELYLYNRNAPASISEFIKGKIQEEDDDKSDQKNKSLNDSNSNQQKDEDFMFQMDKEPNFAKSNIKQPDDLDSLLLNSLKLKFDEHDTTLIEEDGVKEIEEGEDGKQFDLNSLAKIYSSSDLSESKPMEIKFGLDDLSKPCNDIDIMSTSIDKLLDNFFLNNFQENKNFQRTKSISICEEKLPEPKSTKETNTFSLNDLATEYLSTMTPTSTAQTPLGSSLVDLIDYEFNQRLSINEDNEERKVDLKENILINKRDRGSSARFSIGSDLISSSVSSSTSLTNRNIENFSLNKIQFVPVLREHGTNLQIENLFKLNYDSEIADFLSDTLRESENESNLKFEENFNYEKQKLFSEENKPKRNKILVDLTNEQNIQLKDTKKPTTETAPSTPKSQNKPLSKVSTPTTQSKSLTKQQTNNLSNSQQKSNSVAKQLNQLSDLRISPPPPLDPAKKEKLLKQYEEHTAGKDVISLIVIGHVDSGKSTLMGHLLYQMGHVSDKQLHKFKQDSQKIGKSSFAYAWVLDETEEERSRGITIDVAQTKFETEKKIIYLLDAPGHKDFIPNMITGATQADSAILVINSITGEFETGFLLGGQTREHSLLVKSLGINQLIIAVNKMDMNEWSQERFLDIHKKLSSFLIKQVGYKEADLMFVPCSGLQGENLTKKCTNEKLTSWYNENSSFNSQSIIGGSTLLDCMNRLKPQERSIDKPFRFCVSDVYKSAQTANISISGKCEAGSLKTGDKILIVPSNENGVVKSIATNDEQSLQMCFAGDTVTLNVANVDINNISIGNFGCDLISPPMPVSDRIRARVILFNLEIPMTNGFPVVFHYKSLNEAAVVKKLVSLLDKSSGEVVKEKPRVLNNGQSAIVEIKINRPICVELYQNYRELGRFMLRYNGVTIAAGQITEIIVKNKN